MKDSKNIKKQSKAKTDSYWAYYSSKEDTNYELHFRTLHQNYLKSHQ